MSGVSCVQHFVFSWRLFCYMNKLFACLDLKPDSLPPAALCLDIFTFLTEEVFLQSTAVIVQYVNT